MFTQRTLTQWRADGLHSCTPHAGNGGRGRHLHIRILPVFEGLGACDSISIPNAFGCYLPRPEQATVKRYTGTQVLPVVGLASRNHDPPRPRVTADLFGLLPPSPSRTNVVL